MGVRNVKIVYFAYLLPNKWFDIVVEQLDSLKNLDLYNIASDIFISVTGEDEEVEKIKTLLKEKYEKIQIYSITKENTYEYPGIKTVYEISQHEDSIILYFHTKGMVSNDHEVRKNVFDWTIKNYEEIITEFVNDEKLDIVCAIPHLEGFAYYNFFWVTSDYVKNYCEKPIIQSNRYYWESWLRTGNSNKRQTTMYSPLMKHDRIPAHDSRLVAQVYNKFKK